MYSSYQIKPYCIFNTTFYIELNLFYNANVSLGLSFITQCLGTKYSKTGK